MDLYETDMGWVDVEDLSFSLFLTVLGVASAMTVQINGGLLQPDYSYIAFYESVSLLLLIQAHGRNDDTRRSDHSGTEIFSLVPSHPSSAVEGTRNF